MGLLGILVALGLLIWLAFRGWSVLLLAPAAALIAAAAAREPLLAHWTQTFMTGAASFLAQFFPLFLLGALFGKLMDDSDSVQAIAQFMTERLGPHRAMLAVVLAGAMITYGGVSLFVAFFVLAPMAQSLFQAADIPHQLMPAAIVLGTSTFTVSAIAGNAGHSERDSHAVLRDYAVRGARPWHHRVACHADLRVAPLGLIGVVAALLLSGRPLGFVAILGILALFGLITKNAVILIGQIEAEREHGKTVLAGGHRRQQLSLPSHHADGGVDGARHDPDRHDRVLGAHGIRDHGRAPGRHGSHVGVPADALCGLVRR